MAEDNSADPSRKETVDNNLVSAAPLAHPSSTTPNDTQKPAPQSEHASGDVAQENTAERHDMVGEVARETSGSAEKDKGEGGEDEDGDENMDEVDDEDEPEEGDLRVG